MLTQALVLFLAGSLTILLPCILPLVPVVLGATASDRHPLRPLVLTAGMVVSFVLSTFLLQVVLGSFVEFADYVRIGTFYALFLFGLGFALHQRIIQLALAAASAVYFFWDKGWIAILVAALLGVFAMEIGGRVASRLQSLSGDIQQVAGSTLGRTSLLSSFILGTTLGLAWAPCAGPALGFALAVVRDDPGTRALVLLTCYALGSALPLLLIGYGGQAAVHTVRSITPYTDIIKKVAGVFLLVTALGLQSGLLLKAQAWIAEHTGFGTLGSQLEDRLLGGGDQKPEVNLSDLPVLGRAPEFEGLGTWHNSEPLTMESLRGKVVLIDFWTYSCINCIRTLPYVRAYWDKYRDSPFVLIGIHTPEFVFEKSDANVARAVRDHGLTYPVAQDNDFGTWNAFGNRYWPAKYLIDAEGRVRYTHFGEGSYDETDDAIASLLREINANGKDMAIPEDTREYGMRVTPETYLHSRSWGQFQNKQGSPDEQARTYDASEKPSVSRFVLGGTWKLVEDERQVLASEAGEIRINALAGEVNLVLGMEEGFAPAQAEVIVDGKTVKTFTVDAHDLYVLYDGEYGEHDVRLILKGKGVGAYAYTFGG